MTFNLSLAIYAFCKISACRDILTRSDIAMDQVLTQPAFNDSPKVKNNTSRALKNLASDLNEAIEEGMVANLIAISLEVRYFVSVLQV